MSEVENSEGQEMRAKAEEHAAFLQEHLNDESLKEWGEAGLIGPNDGGLLAKCLEAENYIALSDAERAQVDQLIEDIREKV